MKKEILFCAQPSLKHIRHHYSKKALPDGALGADPLVQFGAWLQEAFEQDAHYAHAMTLSTLGEGGMPDSRIVLLRDISHHGFTFFTNYESKKGRDLQHHPKASLLFFWKELERQVRVQGGISLLPSRESDDYFASRPFESRVAAHVSQQSQPVASRELLDLRFEKELARLKDKPVQRPAQWGGYVLSPVKIEFWQGRPGRLHDRICYTKIQQDRSWQIERLMP